MLHPAVKIKQAQGGVRALTAYYSMRYVTVDFTTIEKNRPGLTHFRIIAGVCIWGHLYVVIAMFDVNTDIVTEGGKVVRG